jgi:hypothetical protein
MKRRRAAEMSMLANDLGLLASSTSADWVASPRKCLVGLAFAFGPKAAQVHAYTSSRLNELNGVKGWCLATEILVLVYTSLK